MTLEKLNDNKSHDRTPVIWSTNSSFFMKRHFFYILTYTYYRVGFFTLSGCVSFPQGCTSGEGFPQTQLKDSLGRACALCGSQGQREQIFAFRRKNERTWDDETDLSKHKRFLLGTTGLGKQTSCKPSGQAYLLHYRVRLFLCNICCVMSWVVRGATPHGPLPVMQS